MSVFRHKLWKVDLKSTNAGFIELLTYMRIQCPVILRDDSPINTILASLKSDIFTKGEVLALKAKMASYLEFKGDHVNRSKIIEGSKMNAFGMQ